MFLHRCPTNIYLGVNIGPCPVIVGVDEVCTRDSDAEFIEIDGMQPHESLQITDKQTKHCDDT